MVTKTTAVLLELAHEAEEAKRREKAQRRMMADAVVDLLLERARARALLREIRQYVGDYSRIADEVDEFLDATETATKATAT